MVKNKKYKIVEPNPEDLLESVRSFGYSIDTAIADLIDNSISALSTIIHIDFVFNKVNSFVRIEDNGIGMKDSPNSDVGIGIFTIKERVNKLNGKVSFVSNANGFRLILKFQVIKC